MIYFCFNIDRPSRRKYNESIERQKDYILFERSLTENKTLSIQLSKSPEYIKIFGITVDMSIWSGKDHAGFIFEIDLMRYFFIFSICDNRHWNYEKNRYYTKEELEAKYQESLKNKE